MLQTDQTRRVFFNRPSTSFEKPMRDEIRITSRGAIYDRRMPNDVRTPNTIKSDDGGISACSRPAIPATGTYSWYSGHIFSIHMYR